MFWAKQESVRNDLVDIHINKLVAFQEEDEEEAQVFTLATGSGCWTSHLEFDGQVLWRVYDPVLPWKS